MPLRPYDPDTVFAPPPTPRPSTSPYPQLSPQDEESLLGRIGGGLLSGVGALGKFLDETFGGRAVRGLLGGHPRELLSFLPLSDTVGLTDPEERTSGRELLEKAGLVGRPEPGLEFGDIAGFATEVATSPLTYINPFGPLTQAGKLWSRTSPKTLPKTFGGQMRGGEYAAEQVAKLPPVAAGELPPGLALPDKASMIPREVSEAARAQGIELLPRQTRLALHEADLPVPFGPSPGPVPPFPAPGVPSYQDAIGALEQGQFPPAGSYVGNATTKGFRTLDVAPSAQGQIPGMQAARHAFLDAPGGGQGTPLASAFSVKVPFGPEWNFGTGPWSQWYADKLGGLNQKLHGFLGISPFVSKRLQTTSAERTTAEGQELARDFFRPKEAEVMKGARGHTFDFGGELAPQLEKLPVYEGHRLATLAAEGRRVPLTGADWAADLAARDPQLTAKLATEGKLNVPDEVFRSLQATGHKMGEAARATLAPEAALGMPAVPQKNYFPRELVKLEGQPHPAGPGLGKALSGHHASQLARNDLWEEFPGGSTQINDLFRTRNAAGESLYTGPARLSSDADTEAKVLELVHGHSDPARLSQGQLKHAEEVAALLKTSDPRRATLGYFNANPLEALGMRETRGALGQGGAETVLAGIRRHGQPLAELGDQEIESITGLLQRAKLTGKGLPDTGEQIAPGLAAQRLGLESTEDLSKYGVPKHIADDLMDLGKPSSGRQNYYDKALNEYRSWLYGAWPAAQARNRVWGAVSNMLQGVGPIKQWQGRNDTYNLLKGTGTVEPYAGLEGLRPGMSQAEIQNLIKREMFTQNANFTPQTLARHATENSPSVSSLDRMSQTLTPPPTAGSFPEVVGNFFKGLKPAEGQTLGQALNPLNHPGGFIEDVGPGGGNRLLHSMREVGQTTEALNRGSLYIPLRRQGYSAEAAGQLSNQTHHLYNDLTNWERDVGRRLALFPTFSLRNLPMLGKTFARDPGPLNALIKASSGGLRSPGDFVPPYLAEATAIPLGGATEEGQQRYLSGLGLGYEDEGVKALGSLLGMQYGRAAGTVLGQLSPFIKFPIEQATGQQLHTGRKLEDLRPGSTATSLARLGGLVGEDRAGAVAQLLANSPASRAVSTLDKLVDERKGLLPKASNLLTGVKITDVDLARQKEIATRHLVEESLRGQPGFGAYEKLYVRPEKVGQLSPDEFLLMSLYTQLEKQAIAAAKARKALQGPVPGVPAP